jgi:secernin
MCDTLCAATSTGTLFAKNSDRPPHEAQIVEPFARRSSGGSLHTQYLTLPDAGAHALLGSRPAWLWGAEHGVNEHRVAIGNEKVWTTDDPGAAPPALLGMDLVRLALERARTADEAIDHLTELLEAHGQGGSGEEDHDEPYFSSFLIADPNGGWIVETSQRTWAARPVGSGAAISNRIALGHDWTRASADVAPGSDFQDWRDPKVPTAIADRRLAATEPCVASGIERGGDGIDPRELVATLRSHGAGPWGAPGSETSTSPPPTDVDADWNGITVCMHLRDYQATTASIVADLPADPDAVPRAWVALGSPCASVYVPVFPPHLVPPELRQPATWKRFAALRDRIESDPDALASIRARLAPVEAELWDRADTAVGRHDPVALDELNGAVWAPVEDALRSLGV